MDIPLTAELEAKLNRIASEMGTGASQLILDLLTNYLDHEEWFRREVGRGLASLDRGKSISHDEVWRQTARILDAK